MHFTDPLIILCSQRRHQAKTVAQLKDFVGKLGGLQNEHQSLGLREYFFETLYRHPYSMGHLRHTPLRDVGSPHTDDGI